MNDRELLVIVQKARALVARPDRWSTRNYAEDETGRWVPVGSASATRFNLEGALVRGAGISARAAMPALVRVFGQVSPDLVALGSLTREGALQLLDSAIARLTAAASLAQPSPQQSGIRVHPGAPQTGHTGTDGSDA